MARWTNRQVYELLCKIDEGYQPDAYERALLENWIVFSLHDSTITSLPDSVGQLKSLKGMYLSYTGITALPESVGQLSSLQIMTLIGTRITALPESVGQLSGLRSLTLSGTRITVLPESLGQLSGLQELYLNGTRITDLPESLGQLSNLRELDLNGTQITALPESLGQLGNLRKLDLNGTQITALPESLGQLTNLQWLDLHDTPITALPESLGQLSSMGKLNLSVTQLTALPESLGQLTALRELYLSGTQITTLPDLGQLTGLKILYLSKTKITDLPEWIGELPALQKLNLAQLSLSAIPRSLALKGLAFVNTPDFFHDVSGINLRRVTLTEQDINVFLEHPELIPSLYQDQIRVRECRVLFLGDGDSGKTYTIRRIQAGGKKETPENPYPTKETPGVEIADWQVDRGEDSFTIHFWDFGGQELLHSMHRCFLADQSCYVVTVKSRETKGTDRARYWLRNVTAFAPHSPVLLYVNCWENDEGRRTIDEPRLRKEYPNIVKVVYVSAMEAEDGAFADQLMKPLIEMAANSEALKRTVNSGWDSVRQAILKESDGKGEQARHYLTKERYHALCQQASVEDENAAALLSYFNALGVCFSYHRDADNNELDNYKLLNPVWLTNAVYAIIEEGMSQAQEGRIRLDAIQDMLSNKAPDKVRGRQYRRTVPELIYRDFECRYVLDVAIAHDLCYRVDLKTLFFPALCTKDTPAEALEDQAGFPSCEKYRFRYDYLPDSLLHRLMIRCMKKGFAVRETWLQGMILDDPEAHRAIIRMEDDETLAVELWHKTERPAWELFPMLRAEILDVGRNLNLNVRTECIVDGKEEFKVVALLNSHRNGQKTVCGEDPDLVYKVYELLTRFYDAWTVQNLEIVDKRLQTRPYRYHACKKDKPALRRAVWEAFEKKCVYCGQPLMYNEIQIDHVLAVNRKRTEDPQTKLFLAELKQRGFREEDPDYIENYVLSCGPCNRTKSNEVWSASSLRFYHEQAMKHSDEVRRLTAKYESDLRKAPAAETESSAKTDTAKQDD